MIHSDVILLVEDSEADYEATVRALRTAGLANPMYRCADGEQALDFLYRRGVYADPFRSPRPGVILLDLNLPGTDGHEVLRDVKGDAGLKQIPVIVLTTSIAERDIAACYQDGANSYIVKPVGFENLVQAIQRLQDYWFELVVLPKAGA
ncbi:MAG: response regulator [Gammaproteobacteria bacterium]